MSGKETKLAKREATELNPAAFMQQAIAQNLTPEVMEKFMNLYDRWEAKKSKKEFDEAMAAFQGECPVIDKGRKVDFESKRTGQRTKYSYASLDQIVKQVGKIIAKHDLSYTITATILKDAAGKPEAVEATVSVTHVGGHTERSSFMAPLDPDAFMNAAQKFGSALTYAKRYAFCNAFGILTQDPDTDANNTGSRDAANGKVYENALKMIGAAKSLEELADFKASIETGRAKKLYNDEQKAQLVRLIDGKAKEFTNA